ncbi:MAG: hypothetical protein HKN32_02925, partial [Flavobacteriales bacterium]|nr:hypothetical protein [Flavobacteriales bacterium]
GEYVNGVKDGIWITFLSDGKIERTIKYDMGTKVSEKLENGVLEEYWDNAIPKATYEYKDGKLHGPFTEWYDQGEWVRRPTEGPERELGYQFKEELEGTQISREGDYRNGKLDGEITYYDEDGRIIKIEIYAEGELESVEER